MERKSEEILCYLPKTILQKTDKFILKNDVYEI